MDTTSNMTISQKGSAWLSFKIANFCHTEECYTKKWGKMSPTVLFYTQTNKQTHKQSHIYRWCPPKNKFSTEYSILYIKDFSAPTIGQTFARVLFVQVSLCPGETYTQTKVKASY